MVRPELLSLSDHINTMAAGTTPPGELPVRLSTFTPEQDKAAIQPDRDKLYDRLKEVHVANDALGPSTFCTHPDAQVTLTVKQENQDKIYRKQYAVAHALRPAVTEILNRWKQNGKIVPATKNCRYNSPLLAVAKKDDNGRMTGIRVCADVRLLNKYLQEDDKFQLPYIPEMLSAFAGAVLFGEYDLSEAYFQFPVSISSQPLTAFTWENQQYMFAGCPFGIKHIPSFFQRFITHLFRDMPFVLPYIDNIAFAST